MNNPGENICETLRQLRILCQQLANLIMTTDALMLDHDWNIQSSQCVSLGYVANRPEAWFPEDIYHFYINKDKRLNHLAAFISVTVTDRGDPTKIQQPVISTGVFDFGTGTPAPPLQPWYAHIYSYLKNPDFIYQFKTIDQSTEWPEWNPYFKTVSLVAIPLMDINDSQSLNNKLILPLINQIKEVRLSNRECLR